MLKSCHGLKKYPTSLRFLTFSKVYFSCLEDEEVLEVAARFLPSVERRTLTIPF